MGIRALPLFLRKIKLKNKKILNPDISIISNNCTGGIMYHDLGLRFNSPTINLYFNSIEQFYYFCTHIYEYTKFGKFIESKKKEIKQNFQNAPIGILECPNLPSLEIHFLHYKSFNDAVEKWNERCERINFDKIYIVIEATNSDAEKLSIFKNFSYPVTAFTNKELELPFSFNMKFYKKYGTDDRHPILKLVNIFGRRGFDEYDFIDNIFNYSFGESEK